MSDSTVETKTITFMRGGSSALSGAADDEIQLAARFARLSGSVKAACALRFPAQAAQGGEPALQLASVAEFLDLMAALDQRYGPDATLPMSDAGEAVDESLRCLAELEGWLSRLDLAAERPALFAVQLGVAWWAMRHRLEFATVAPVVNALAEQANTASSRQETAAVFAMMQGLVGHLAPALGPDLERSNPERPWRLLNLNLAITAIRSGDDAMIRYAFDTLNANLPDERAGFYEEAHALACQPGFPPETRSLIEAEYARWTRTH